jgi:hypothetical protein
MKMFNPQRLLLLLLLITVVNVTLSAQDAVREFRESFDVSKGITVSSDTRYSDVELINWDRDEVEVVAEVEVNASSRSRAEEKIEKINVDIRKSGNTVTIETDLEEGWSRNVKVDIHITVKAPSYLNFSLESWYGDVFVQDVDGLAILDIKYGNLSAGNLNRGNEKPYNSIELDYSDGTIEKAGWIEVQLAYSDLEIENSSMIYADSKYSKLLGSKTGGIVAEGAYDKYYFDEVDNFVAELRYSGVKFGLLKKKFEVESKYTNIKLMDVPDDFKEVNINSSYGNIYVNVDDQASFKIEAETKYGNVNVAQEGRLSSQKENNYKKVWGTVGSSPKGSMMLEARYGNITVE